MIGSTRRLAHVFAAVALAAGVLVALGASPAAAADPLGYVVVQGEGECWLASVDLVTAETTSIGTPSSDKCAFDLEFTPDGTHLLGTRIDDAEGDDGGTAVLVEFDLTTGSVTTLSDLGDFPVGGPGATQGNITFGSDAQLYTYLVPFVAPQEPTADAVDPACDGSAFCLFQVDQTDPTDLTYLNSVAHEFTVYYGLATSCAGVTSSVNDAESDTDSASWNGAGASIADPQELSQVSLTATVPGTTDVAPISGAFVRSLDYDTAGALYGVGFNDADQASLFTIDPATGETTQVDRLNDGTDPINVGVLGFAIAHPCSAPPPPVTPIEPPAAQPIAAVTPRFTG